MNIGVFNRKGGVGKTTMAGILSVGLASRGLRVGLIDTDAQGNIALNFGLSESEGLFNVLVGGQDFDGNVIQLPESKLVNPDDKVFVLPGSVKTSKLSSELGSDGAFKFLEMTEKFNEQYELDVTIIDTQPSIMDNDGATYLATDGYVFITQCAVASLNSLGSAYQQAQRMKAHRSKYLRRDTLLMGIIPNMYRNTDDANASMIALQETFAGDIWTPIPLATSIVEAFTDQQTALTYRRADHVAPVLWENVARLEAICRTIKVV